MFRCSLSLAHPLTVHVVRKMAISLECNNYFNVFRNVSTALKYFEYVIKLSIFYQFVQTCILCYNMLVEVENIKKMNFYMHSVLTMSI